MSCDACKAMLFGAASTAHSHLLKSGQSTRLRPLGRSSIDVALYRCDECGMNWLLETDMSVTGKHEWICLYGASSILEPGSVLTSASHTNNDHPEVARESAAHAVESALPYQFLIQLGSLPFI